MSTPGQVMGSVSGILGYLGTLAKAHPDFVFFLLKLVRAAANAPKDPYRAFSRKLVSELAQRVGKKTANEILGLERVR